jgi:hypothetical protein
VISVAAARQLGDAGGDAPGFVHFELNSASSEIA